MCGHLFYIIFHAYFVTAFEKKHNVLVFAIPFPLFYNCLELQCVCLLLQVRNYSNSIGAFFQTFEAELERAEPINISHGNLI